MRLLGTRALLLSTGISTTLLSGSFTCALEHPLCFPACQRLEGKVSPRVSALVMIRRPLDLWFVIKPSVNKTWQKLAADGRRFSPWSSLFES